MQISAFSPIQTCEIFVKFSFACLLSEYTIYLSLLVLFFLKSAIITADIEVKNYMMTQKVSKSSIRLSLFKLRRLVLALVFLFAAQGVWGQTTYTWTGTENAVITNLNNWKTATEDPATSLPGNTDSVIIPSGCPYYPSITSVMVNNIASIKVDGQLTIEGDFTLSIIDAASEGTLIVTGTLTNSSNFLAEDLFVVFNSYQSDSGWLKCKKITIDGTGDSSISGSPILVSTTADGINFNKSVEIDASGGQCVLAGNVYASRNISINVTSGMLNHVKEQKDPLLRNLTSL